APSLRAEHEAHTRYEPHPIRVRQTPFDPDPRSIMVAKLKYSSDSIRLPGTVYRPVAAPYSAIVLLALLALLALSIAVSPLITTRSVLAAQARGVTIRGLVVDSATSLPLPGSNVRV